MSAWAAGLSIPGTTSSDDSSWHKSLWRSSIYQMRLFVVCVNWNIMVSESSVVACLRIDNGICTSDRLSMPGITSSYDSSWHKSLWRSSIHQRWLCVVCVSWNVIVCENSVMTCLHIDNGVCTSDRPVDDRYYFQLWFQLTQISVKVQYTSNAIMRG